MGSNAGDSSSSSVCVVCWAAAAWEANGDEALQPNTAAAKAASHIRLPFVAAEEKLLTVTLIAAAPAAHDVTTIAHQRLLCESEMTMQLKIKVYFCFLNSEIIIL